MNRPDKFFRIREKSFEGGKNSFRKRDEFKNILDHSQFSVSCKILSQSQISQERIENKGKSKK